MRCLLPSINFKVLGKAVATLSRIGDELYLEPYKDGINLRTVNPNRSAFASFNFTQSFFSYYNLHATSSDLSNLTSTTGLNNKSNEDEEPLRCKVTMKSILGIFRTPSNVVETCQIQIDPDGGQLIFQLRCRHSIRKTYYVPVIECETIQAVYSKDNSPNKFCAQSRVLSDVIQNFQKNHEEISLTVNSNRIFFRNYSDNSTDSRRAAVRTEVNLESLEFDAYNVGPETSITFSLLELRALLMFAESTSLPVVAHFESPGRPIVFIISSLPSFEAHFVLATMTQQQNEYNNSQAQSESSSLATTNSEPRVQKRISSFVQKRDSGDGKRITIDVTDVSNTHPEQLEVEAAEENLDLTYAMQQSNTTDTPKTPPWLQAQRFFFPHCFRDTQRIPSPSEILCPDSDPEDLT